mgnify:CR=1 FL=1|tara:strand:- start:8 stop:646 length:639 start_codon:yes stop_codon:yes gene_type:complete
MIKLSFRHRFLLSIFTLLAGVFFMSQDAYSQSNSTQAQEMEKAIFAAGCFWCIEKDMEKLEGVVEAVSGYTGGRTENPTYQDVSTGTTGHREAIQVTFDPSKVSYSDLLDVFWKNHDPFDNRGQFCDVGFQYTAAIYYLNNAQKKLAEESKAEAEKALGQEILTEIEPAATFYNAEDYHQNYYEKNPIRYNFYRWNCGRDQRLEEIWSKSEN